MILTFESILPVFLLVLLGVGLKRWPLINGSLWDGLEQLGFYVLFPALLFVTLSQADFSAIETGAVSIVANLSVLLMSIGTLALWPLLRRNGVDTPAFTTIFQTTTRWNGFMALAIAEKVAGPSGLTLVALVMAAIIVPLNFINVGVMVWFGGGDRNLKDFAVKIISNPIILGAGTGVIVNLTGLPIYGPLMQTVELVSQSSLSLGLIMVGAGLKISDALKPHPSAVLATVLKLIVFPIVMVALALAFDVEGEALTMLALSAAVPTAMNGYLLAKQMGGDAPLYAATATIQTAAAFFTIPAVLFVVSL
ncbi:AEC family transporter [Agrobacterium sp. a22-2]|uniref:AEC family transporter n=1 Tax=Agrobacterium sp. a22-2 TaxID=2283840 RepID=UPI001446582A|nr:AEC family transporter [Agrobacterium sp. a22-2]NKN36758.1 AEC family transporter [Agrobacterium sp. a22-2]